MPIVVRTRFWCFTLNNPTDDDRGEIALATLGGNIGYLTYQPERGENGTPHLQGFVYFPNRRTMGGAKQLLGVTRVHLESMRGSVRQAIDYCHKDDTRDGSVGYGMFEYGDSAGIPSNNGQGSRSDLSSFGDRIRAGESLQEIAEEDFTTYVKYHRGIASWINLQYQSKPCGRGVIPDAPRVLWLYGTAGSGKTRAAVEEADTKSVYFKPADSKWWCGYAQEECVILDDFRANWFPFSYLLRLLDIYPLSVEVKGGMIQFNSKLIIITNTMRPEQVFHNLAEQNDGKIQQLLRRITEVRCVGEEPTYTPNVDGFRPS